MRRHVFLLAITSFVAGSGMTCCGTGMPGLFPRTVVDVCTYAPCALALKAETAFGVDSGVAASAYVSPATLGSAAITDDGDVVVHPHGHGTGLLVVTLTDGSTLERPLATAEIATATHELEPYEASRADRFFAGTRLHATLHYLDAAGAPLLGHGGEAWSADGATLIAPIARTYDTTDVALTREIVTSTPGIVRVSASPNAAPLELDIAGAGETAAITFADGQLAPGSAIELEWKGSTSFWIGLHDGAGRSLYGAPPGGITIHVAQPTVATAVLYSDSRTLRVTGNTTGSTTVDVTADGVTARLTIHVR